jgi:hypothetical protein
VNALVENQFNTGGLSTQSSAGVAQVEQREQAEVQSMVIMAKRFPRNPLKAMDNIINAFTRTMLAEQSQYQFSKGGSEVAGPSIRSAEAIAQQWGNIDWGFREVSRGVGANGVPFSEVVAYAWDLETVSRRALQFIVPHWRDTKSGGYRIKEERDIYELVANMAQRRVRACLLGVIPGDVTEQAMKQADVTLRAAADTSPEAMQKMVDAFGIFEVTKEQIEKRIQRRLDAIQPAQVVTLKRIYVSLRDGMSTVADWFEVAGEGEVGTGQAEAKPPYPQDKFEKNLPGWRDLIAKGNKTVEQIIATAESKHPLTDDQKKAIAAPGAQSDQDQSVE